MTTAPFDQAEHPREGDGRFAVKPAAEAAGVALGPDSYGNDRIDDSPAVDDCFTPSSELHDRAYAVERATESYTALLRFADRVDEFFEDDLSVDLDEEEVTQVRYLHVVADGDPFSEESATIRALDADGNALAASSRSGWTTWYSGTGFSGNVPDVPPDFRAIEPPAGHDEHESRDLPISIVDLERLRDFDWEARERQFHNDVVRGLI